MLMQLKVSDRTELVAIIKLMHVTKLEIKLSDRIAKNDAKTSDEYLDCATHLAQVLENLLENLLCAC